MNNFYTTGSNGQMVPQSYTNASDTGTAQLVTNPVIVHYYDQMGMLCTWNSTNYFVLDDKIGLVVGNWWPLTDRRQDCIQIQYWAGRHVRTCERQCAAANGCDVSRKSMWENRSIVSVEPTSEVWGTLTMMLRPFMTYRIPR